MIKALIITTYIQISLCVSQWTHSVYLFDSGANKSSSPELFMQKSLMDQVQKKVVLEGTIRILVLLIDGRTVTCNIPLDPSIYLRKYKNNATSLPKIQQTINDTLASQVLFPLNNMRATHHTHEFIWEFIFKKQVRQYDDESTIRNVQKKVSYIQKYLKAYEEFYIGFSNSFNESKQQREFYTPPWMKINLVNAFNQILANQNEQVTQLAIIDGYMMKILNSSVILKYGRQYFIELQISQELFIQQPETIQLSILTLFNKTNNKYIAMIPIHCVVHSKLLILSEKVPFKLLIHHFQLHDMVAKTKEFSTQEIYFHGNLIFGTYLMAQQHFLPGLQVAGLVDDMINLFTVKDVLDTSLVVLEEEIRTPKQGIKPIRLFILDQKDSQFYMVSNPVLVQENILFIEDMSLIKGDTLLTLPQSSQILSYPKEYLIEQSYIPDVYILNPQFTQGLFYEGLAVIARRVQLQPKDLPQQQRHMVSTVYTNQIIIEQLTSRQLIILQEKKFISQDVYDYNFKKEIHIDPTNNNIYAFQFFLDGMKKSKSYEFHLKLNLNSAVLHDVELLFFSHPSPYIMARQFGTKGVYTQMDSRFANQTLLGKFYWVLVDVEMKTVYVGLGEQVSLATMMVEYKITSKKDISTPSTNIFVVEILAHDSYGVKIDQFESVSTQLRNERLIVLNIQNHRIPWLTDTNYTPLNYSAFTALSQLNLTMETEEQHVKEFQYHETYNLGSYCPAVNESRSINVVMMCDPTSLMKIISVNEPKICKYKMKVGTKLLCDPKEEVSALSQVSQGQRMMCVVD